MSPPAVGRPDRSAAVVPLVKHAALAGRDVPQLARLVWETLDPQQAVPYDDLARGVRPVTGLRGAAEMLDDILAHRLTALVGVPADMPATGANPHRGEGCSVLSKNWLTAVIAGRNLSVPHEQRAAIVAEVSRARCAVVSTAVTAAEEHLKAVLRHLAARSSAGHRLVELAVVQQMIAEAWCSQSTAQALLGWVRTTNDEHLSAVLCADIVRAVGDAVDHGDRLLAGASVFMDTYADMRLLAGRLRPPPGYMTQLPANSYDIICSLRPELVAAARARLADVSSTEPRRLQAVLTAVLPPEKADLIDELVIADVLARQVPIGSCTRVLTQRLMRRHYPANALRRDARLLGALAITEPSGGTDLGGWHTTLRRDGERWRLTGVKTLVAGAAEADCLVVGANLAGDPALVTVRCDAAGVQRRTLPTDIWGFGELGEVTLTDCLVTDDDVLAGPTVAASLRAGLTAERLVLSAIQLAQASTWTAVLAQEIAAPLQSRHRGCSALVNWAATRVLAGAADAAAAASAAKLRTAELAVDIADARVEALIGTDTEEVLEEALSALRDTRAARFAGGSPEAQRMLITLNLVDGT